MLDDLAAYRAEIRAIEDNWFDEQARIDDPRDRPSGSLWTRDWNRLRMIWERHGIRPGDPRIFSIASFRHEFAAIQAQWDRDCWERQKLSRANPGFIPPFGREYNQYRNQEENCQARHFPMLDCRRPESTADSIPKAWFFIKQALDLAEIYKGIPTGLEILDSVSRKRAEETYSILLRLQVPWALDPAQYPRNFTGKQYRDQLQFFANRLEREEAESLPPEIRRMFAIGPAEPEPPAPEGVHALTGPPTDADRPAGTSLAAMLGSERPRASIQRALLEFMADRGEATFEEVANAVHGDKDASEAAIRANVTRVNSFLEGEDRKIPIRFQCGSGRVLKRENPR